MIDSFGWFSEEQNVGDSYSAGNKARQAQRHNNMGTNWNDQWPTNMTGGNNSAVVTREVAAIEQCHAAMVTITSLISYFLV